MIASEQFGRTTMPNQSNIDPNLPKDLADFLAQYQQLKDAGDFLALYQQFKDADGAQHHGHSSLDQAHNDALQQKQEDWQHAMDQAHFALVNGIVAGAIDLGSAGTGIVPSGISNVHSGKLLGTGAAAGGQNETFTSSRGDDVFTGGKGSDVFAFDSNIGHDTITDFGNGHDTIWFKGVFHDFNDLLAHTASDRHDVVITIDAHNSITLKDVGLDGLHESDFFLV